MARLDTLEERQRTSEDHMANVDQKLEGLGVIMSTQFSQVKSAIQALSETGAKQQHQSQNDQSGAEANEPPRKFPALAPFGKASGAS